ncbi:MAG: ATP-binding protein, partial [Acetatifactor sp.]|nr:ATP-binding protein [Acetatifactor sp.]
YEKTSKEDKVLHCFGIRNITHAVEKYSGQCLIRRGESCFQLKILLPLP